MIRKRPLGHRRAIIARQRNRCLDGGAPPQLAGNRQCAAQQRDPVAHAGKSHAFGGLLAGDEADTVVLDHDVDEVGRDVDAFVIIANWPNARQRHWEVLTQARAIENQAYMIAVNRIGEGGGLAYEGGSVVFDPWGERCDRAAANGSLRIAEITRSGVERARKAFPLPAAVAR